MIQETNILSEKPIIEGPTNIKLEENCWYNITAIDPDSNTMVLYFKEIFGLEPGRLDNIVSGIVLPAVNFWLEKGEFLIKIKTIDPYGAERE